VARRCVSSRNLENEEAKARYWSVKIQPQWVLTPGKQTTNMIMNVHRSSSKAPRFFGQRLIKVELYLQIFEKYSNIKFYENSSSGSRVVPAGQTDMKKLILAYRSLFNYSLSLKNNFFTSILLTSLMRTITICLHYFVIYKILQLQLRYGSCDCLK
jgi:hypothetical protein